MTLDELLSERNQIQSRIAQAAEERGMSWASQSLDGLGHLAFEHRGLRRPHRCDVPSEP
ncbi:hypothetical protein WA016_03443 [Myxococcus stipitatus]